MDDGRRFRRLAAVSAAATYLLVVLGSVVRATGSGLGCPDWPTCFGRLIPPLRRDAIVEYTHRSVAALVGLLIVVVLVAAWRRRRDHRRDLAVASVALAAVIVEAWLGRVVVVEELSPWMVSFHLAMALTLLAVLVVLAVPAGSGTGRRRPEMWWAVAGLFAVMLIGALVRGEGAGLAFADWPLMGGRLIPTHLDVAVRLVQFVHRLAVLVVGGYLVYLWARRRRAGTGVAGVGLLLGLYGLQALVGAANVWSKLAAWAVIGHVAVGTAAFVVALLLALDGDLLTARG